MAYNEEEYAFVDPRLEAMLHEENARFDRFDGWGDVDPASNYDPATGEYHDVNEWEGEPAGELPDPLPPLTPDDDDIPF